MTTILAAPQRLSMSFLRRSGECLRAADLDRGVNVGGDLPTVGRVFHEVAATAGLIAATRGIERLDRDELRGIAERVLANPDAPDPLSLSAYEQVLALVYRWAGTHRFRRGAQVEINSRELLDGRVLSARIDVLAPDGDTVHIDDYKTGPNLPASQPLDDLTGAVTSVPCPPQGRIYAWHAHRIFPEATAFRFAEQYVRYGVTRGPWQLDLDDLRDVEAWLRASIARVDAAYGRGELPATAGSWCAMCPDPDGCPLPARARPASKVTSRKAAEEHLAALLVEQSRMERRKQAIRAWLESSGEQAVASGNRQLGFVRSVERRTDEKLAAAAGVNLDDFRREVDGTRFKFERVDS